MKLKYPCIIVISLLFACKKDSTTQNIETTAAVGGATSGFKDSVSVTQGDVTVKYSRTSACYPSNEIFAFSAIAAGLPNTTKYSWDFGDGNTATTADVRNIYKSAGNYTVTLEVRDNASQLLNKITVSVKAWGQQVTPLAAFSTQINDVNSVNNMTFTSKSTVQNGTLTNYFWDWADGSTTSTINPNAPHNFPVVAADKVYTVKLIVTANSGCRDTAAIPVSVAAGYNIAGDFNAVQYDGCTNEYFIITPTATGVPSGAVYSWDFADATGTATGNPVKKYFTYQNDYDVKMTITYNGNIIYKTSKWVRANGQNVKPKALILKNVASSTATTEKWAFYSQSNIPHGYFTGYYWDLGGGKIDDNFNTYVENVYTKGTTPANYSVKLIVTGNTGCKDTTVANITVAAK